MSNDSLQNNGKYSNQYNGDGYSADGKPKKPAGHSPTQVDAGWRGQNGEASGRTATQVDAGWRGATEGHGRSLDDVMAGAGGAVGMEPAKFHAAAGALTELISAAGNRYRVERVLSTEGGESVILLCADAAGAPVAAKIYSQSIYSAGRSSEARVKTYEYMQTPEGKQYMLTVMDYGSVRVRGYNCFFEIMPYCEQGDLSDAPAMAFDELTALIRHLNEALHSLHQAGILHRDIKPANLYRYDGRVVIGDFGVVKLNNAGPTGLTVRSLGYSAPETQYSVSADDPVFFFDEKCDYYSLGVTIADLFEGRFVYEGMDARQITLFIKRGRLPLTRSDPHRAELENLINGLVRYDPARRFGYEDVCRWLENHNYTGAVEADEWPRPLSILGRDCSDEKTLFEEMTCDQAHWTEAREMLYGRHLQNFFSLFRTDLSRAAEQIEQTWRVSDPDRGLAIFLKHLFPAGPLVWRGYTFRSLSELAERMMVARTPEAYGEMLEKQLISHWLDHTEGLQVSEQTRALVDQIETLAQREARLACYWFGFAFAKEKRLTVFGQEVHDPAELLGVLFDNPWQFYTEHGYEMLTDRAEGPALYGFLYSFGYAEALEQLWERAGETDELHRFAAILNTLDLAAQDSGTDTAGLREFLRLYGPLGIAVCVKQLVDLGDRVYRALDEAGEQLLSQIRAFTLVTEGTAEELFRAYVPLLELTDRLHAAVQDDPVQIEAGLYEPRGVLCANLLGVFDFRIMGEKAPLAFYDRLTRTKENNNG